MIAQGLIVVEIFIASGDTEHSLMNQSVELITNLFRCAGTMKHGGQVACQAMLFIYFTKQEQSVIGGNVATGEIGFNLMAGECREGQLFRYHFVNDGWCLMDWLGS